jgi:hypothetical protein
MTPAVNAVTGLFCNNSILRLPTTINCGGEGAVLQDVTLQCGIFLTFTIFRIPKSFNFIQALNSLTTFH